ncbi:hypothetical protein M413DRAFT_382087 [Hebeloma cylindrosporum]|uniref:Uncharacterized protein n=1 Tax=Hebeloma cylindrosporum TaxID=76867 RepID=A0A0C2YR21_HEBCY|nr:hypothetical protein M413DRAFT_382087 [Hebeloma cylindrosporum h7]
MPLTNPMPPIDAKTLVVVSLRDVSHWELLDLLCARMGATSTGKICEKVALHGLPEKLYIPSRSGGYTGYKALFHSADEGNPSRSIYWKGRLTEWWFLATRAHACLNLHATRNIAPYNTLFVFRPPRGEDRFSSFSIGTGVRHITAFSKTQERSQVFDALAASGSVSFLYPDAKVGWIVHFETEVEACAAESKISRAYEEGSVQRVVSNELLTTSFEILE